MAEYGLKNSEDSRRFLRTAASWRSWLVAVYSRVHLLLGEREAKLRPSKAYPVTEDNTQK